jgi:hypothetical protein
MRRRNYATHDLQIPPAPLRWRAEARARDSLRLRNFWPHTYDIEVVIEEGDVDAPGFRPAREYVSLRLRRAG